MPRHDFTSLSDHDTPWTEQTTIATASYSPVVRLGTVAFWLLIAALLVARVLIATPEAPASDTTSAPPPAHTTSLQ